MTRWSLFLQTLSLLHHFLGLYFAPTNPVESPFAALRLRTDAAKRYKRVDRAIAVIWKMLMAAEGRFRRLKAQELIEDVYLGAQYADGIAIESTAEMVAA